MKRRDPYAAVVESLQLATATVHVPRVLYAPMEYTDIQWLLNMAGELKWLQENDKSEEAHEKALVWLGYIQGCLRSWGYCTVEEFKTINRKHTKVLDLPGMLAVVRPLLLELGTMAAALDPGKEYLKKSQGALDGVPETMDGD